VTRAAAFAQFTGLGAAAKLEWAAAAAEHLGSASLAAFVHAAQADLALPLPAAEQAVAERVLRVSTVLLTWQGSWGVFELPPQLAGTVPAVVAHLLESPAAMEQWRDFEGLIREWTQRHNVHSWACSMELCTRTLRDSGVARIHAHLFFHNRGKVVCRLADEMTFRDCRPVSNETFGVKQTHRNTGANAGPLPQSGLLRASVGCVRPAAARLRVRSR
jgi:hypothetical protein